MGRGGGRRGPTNRGKCIPGSPSLLLLSSPCLSSSAPASYSPYAVVPEWEERLPGSGCLASCAVRFVRFVHLSTCRTVPFGSTRDDPCGVVCSGGEGIAFPVPVSLFPWYI